MMQKSGLWREASPWLFRPGTFEPESDVCVPAVKGSCHVYRELDSTPWFQNLCILPVSATAPHWVLIQCIFWVLEDSTPSSQNKCLQLGTSRVCSAGFLTHHRVSSLCGECAHGVMGILMHFLYCQWGTLNSGIPCQWLKHTVSLRTVELAKALMIGKADLYWE